MVDFFIIGAQKAGTTSLHRYLRQHNEVFMPAEKELFFFEKDELFKNGYDWYHKTYFNLSKKGSIKFGEATPTYIYSERALKRIAAYNPEIKIIFIIRDPIDRSYSHFKMRNEMGSSNINLTNYIRGVMKHGLLEGDTEGFINNSLYSIHLKKVFELFSKSQIYLVDFDKFTNNPIEEYQKILKFLGLKEFIPSNINTIYNHSFKVRFVFLKKFIASIKKQRKTIDFLKRLLNVRSFRTIRWFLEKELNTRKTYSTISTDEKKLLMKFLNQEYDYIDSLRLKRLL